MVHLASGARRDLVHQQAVVVVEEELDTRRAAEVQRPRRFDGGFPGARRDTARDSRRHDAEIQNVVTVVILGHGKGAHPAGEIPRHYDGDLRRQIHALLKRAEFTAHGLPGAVLDPVRRRNRFSWIRS